MTDTASPELSVVIPTYNDAATLPRVLECVLAQEFDNFEVVIVNDAGTSPSQFMKLDDPRVRLVDLPRNGGVSTARNQGFLKTRGRIVHFLDADDYIAPDLYGTVVETLSRDDFTAMIVGQVTALEAEAEENIPHLTDEPRGGVLERYTPTSFYKHFSIKSGQFLPSAAFFDRTALVDRLGPKPWNESLRNGEDTLFFLDFGALHEIVRLPDPFVVYTIRPDSLSRNELASWAGRIDAMDILIARLKAERSDPALLKIARHLRQNAARRTARILREKTRHREALGVLYSDLRVSMNKKSLAEYTRQSLMLQLRNFLKSKNL